MTLDNLVPQLKSIRIENFKNVEAGTIDFKQPTPQAPGSTTALYGQNGSGKSALVEAMSLLKRALQGLPIPETFVKEIRADAEAARLETTFELSNEGVSFSVFYGFSICSQKEPAEEGAEKATIAVFDETLSYSMKSADGAKRKAKVIDTHTEEAAFCPLAKLRQFLGEDIKGAKDKLRTFLDRRLINAKSRNYVFSIEFLEHLKKAPPSEESLAVAACIERLRIWARQELYVMASRESGLISFDALVFMFSLKNRAGGSLPVKIDGSLVGSRELALLKEIVEIGNIVLVQLVPGLNVQIIEGERTVTPDGETRTVVSFASVRNGVSIPLELESDGIKKIVSILQLLIAVYNDPSMTVVIDELDAGIFEYLLGELLSIIGTSARGQLIFTSHNLRPLEVLDPSCIVFTTTNPKDRYRRFKNVKKTNNLRSLYFREISVGDGTFYAETSSIQIARAFRKAGRLGGLR